jgi:hypothetical protein
MFYAILMILVGISFKGYATEQDLLEKQPVSNAQRFSSELDGSDTEVEEESETPKASPALKRSTKILGADAFAAAMELRKKKQKPVQ